MILKGMLKWAVGKDDLGPINPTKSLKKQRRKHHCLDMQRDAGGVGLISGCCKHRNNLQGPSRILDKNRAVRAVGVINPLNNESDNGKVNGHNYKAPDQSLLSPVVQNHNIPCTTTNNASTRLVQPPISTPTSSPHHHNNNTINSDSKSLLYMSLDHLPMVIIKQYERMLREAPVKLPPKSVLKPHQLATSCSNSNSNKNITSHNDNHQSRPSNPKTKNRKQVSPPLKKTHSKSITFKEDVNEGKTNIKQNNEAKKEIVDCLKVVKPYSNPTVSNLKTSEISIKQAQHRPLKVLSALISPTPKHVKPQTLKTSNAKSSPILSQNATKEHHPYNDPSSVEIAPQPKRKIHMDVEKCPKLPAKKSTLLCDNSRSGLSVPETNPMISETTCTVDLAEVKKSSQIQENDENDPNSVPKLPVKQNYGKNFKLGNPVSQPPSIVTTTVPPPPPGPVISATGARLPNPHDTTDPQFLEPKPITYSTPPVAKCAKKLTLKRSELKKLERLKTQTERLSLFLKKYYHDCLPNLPEDEESSCSPEEKSVRLSILKTHWREVKSATSASKHRPHPHFLHNLDNEEHEEEDSEESHLLHSCYENVAKSYKQHRFPYSNPKESNKFSPLHTSSFASYATLPELSVDDYSVTWENLLNASPGLTSSDPSPVGHLPIILEDSGEISSSNNSEYHSHHQVFNHTHSNGGQDVEMARDAITMRGFGLDESFLISRTQIETDDSMLHLTKEILSDERKLHPHLDVYHHDRMSDNFSPSVKISYDDEVFGSDDGEGGGFGMEKLKGLLFQPLGEDLFDAPAEDEGFMSPYPPEAYSPASSSSTSTFNRFSVSSSSGKGSTGGGDAEAGELQLDEHEHENKLEEHYFEDDYDKEQSNFGRTSSQSSSHSSSHSSSSNKSNSSCSGSTTDQEIASMEGGPKYIMDNLKHENTNYLLPAEAEKGSVIEIESEGIYCNNHNETWNSHGYMPTSPCGTISSHSSSSHQSNSTNGTPSSSSSSGGDDVVAAAQVELERDGDEETLNFNSMRNQRENDQGEEESFISNRLALAFSTPARRTRRTSLPQTCLRLKSKKQPTTPRRVVKKPPVNSALSGKGELLIRTYKNDGDYVTVHVVQARRLEAHSHSSWKLSIKVSYLPEADSTFTRSSETILVGRNRSWVKIDQKFSFELPANLLKSNTKVFLTAVKRLGKKSTFLGWTTLSLPNEEKTSCWLKLRKRKMSTTTTNYSTQSCHHSSTFTNDTTIQTPHLPQPSKGGQQRRIDVEPGHSSSARSSSSMDSPSPQPGHMDHGDGSSSSSRCDCEMEPMPKSKLQNSTTMDSGVEDCCEPPPPPAPSIDFEDKNGVRIAVRMTKPDSGGYGFSVVWLSPPRIERLEKGGKADVAGLRIGDLIVGVNGLDVSGVPNTTIYTKMKTTGSELRLEVWRTTPPIQSRSTHSTQNRTIPLPAEPVISHPPPKAVYNPTAQIRPVSNINEGREKNLDVQAAAPLVPTGKQIQAPSAKPISNVNSNINQNLPVGLPSRPQSQSQPPPTSILKSPPPAPPTSIETTKSSSQISQPQPGSSAWRIRFNIELLDNEDDCLKQFFICELKFFRKVVNALDRYLIPAQSNRLLTPQEINLMFSNVIKIITVTKRILNCVANGSSNPGWKLGGVLLSTHSDHLSEMVAAYSSYAKTLGYSSMILSDKMSLQEFARFVLETPVPKGHLDMTSLLFAPLEHLRNICEICEEISHNSNEAWVELFTQLKECYADIVCETDFMEPISHVSMKKNPLLTVRDLEKRVVSTSCQPVKVCEKGRRWLFGSRLFKKESDGSWSPVWAFLFSDIIVLTSHTTRDRVFFVKEAPIRLEDVVTLHFNLPRKHENEFRLLFGPEPVHSRLDKLLPLHRNKKSNQIALRTPNIQLKSIWKLLLQRQIITLNTRLSKSSSSNFSISEFCERFPITPQGEEEQDDGPHLRPSSHRKGTAPPIPISKSGGGSAGNGFVLPKTSNSIFDRPNFSDERNLSVIKEEKSSKPQTKPYPPYAPDGLSSLSKELLKSRVPTRILTDRNKGRGSGGGAVDSIPEEIKVTVTVKPPNDPTDTIGRNSTIGTQSFDNGNGTKTTKIDEVVVVTATNTNTATTGIMQSQSAFLVPPTSSGMNGKHAGLRVEKGIHAQILSTTTTAACSKEEHSRPSTSISMGIQTQESKPSRPSPTNNNNNNNNEIIDFNQTARIVEKCPCVAVDERKDGESCPTLDANLVTRNAPAVKPRTNYGNSQPVKPARARNDSRRISESSLSSPANVESPRPAPRPDLQRNNNNNQTKVILSSSPSPAPSPSMSNNRVDALKYEGSAGSGISIKSKPGSKILTTASLKSRTQQELLAPRGDQGQTIITMVEKPSNNSANDSDCILISQHIEPRVVVNTKDASSSPLLAPRCQSENGFIKPKTVHTDSPILSGFGSDNSRRRVLYDYKVQRDYPELFGITPRDRRTFIKQLAERKPENEKPLVAPYYFSPVPTPKFAKRPGDEVRTIGDSSLEPSRTKIMTSSASPPISKPKPGPSTNNPNKPSARSTTPAATTNGHRFTSTTTTTTTHNKTQQNSKLFNELKTRLIQQNLVESEDTVQENEMSLKDMARGILRNAHSDDEEEEETSEESEESDECHLDEEVRAQVHRQRSPEESSNDSGISDELQLSEKRKSQIGKESNFQSNMAVNSSEVKFSSKMSCSTLVKQSALLPNKSAPSHASCIPSSSPIKPVTRSNKTIDHVCFEGEEKTGMATMVVLRDKADKCTGTEDEYFSHTMASTTTSTSTTFASNHSDKSMRTLMAERREAFFASYNNQSFNYSPPPANHTTFRTNSYHSPVKYFYNNSSPHRSLEPESPLRVKIVDGGTLQSTNPEPMRIKRSKSPPSERVLLTRFPEKERNARVERVESSDSSTSSDLASASPAAENGTTDPSWSSSSSSLAGGSGTTSSKQEEPSTSISTSGATSIYNYKLGDGGSQSVNNSQVASSSSQISKIFMSDFTNGLPSTSFSSGSLSLSGNNTSYTGQPKIVVTQESPETPSTVRNGYSEGEEEASVFLVSKGVNHSNNQHYNGTEQIVTTGKKSFFRVESNDSTVENYGDDDDYNFDEDEDLSQCSAATINRYGTYESLEKIEESEDGLGGLQQDFSNKMTRSKARFTFDDDDSDDENDLFEEDFESDFNFRFPSQVSDNTYSVSRLGPLPPLLEEDFEDDIYDENRPGSSSSNPGPLGNSASTSLVNGGSSLRARHEVSSV